MKRIGTCLLAWALLAVLAVPARADILWEPYGDKFFESHRAEMTLVIRSFLANGKEGCVSLRETPGGRKEAARYENGTKLLVYYVYRDYGLITVWEETDSRWEEFCGWVPLSDLTLVYDRISFQEEYAGQIRPYRDELLDYDRDLSLINYYEYPGAPEIKTAEQPQASFAEEFRNALVGTATEQSAVSQVFTDEEDRTWGYVDYLYGRVEGWFCLDDPGGTDFPVRQVPEVEYVPPQTAAPAPDYLPYILVGGVTAATAGLLYWFYARKRDGERK